MKLICPHTKESNDCDSRASNVVTTDRDGAAVLVGLIEALTEIPPEFEVSTTANFKLTLFKSMQLEGIV